MISFVQRFLVSHLKPTPDCTACSCGLLLPVPNMQLFPKMPIKLSRENIPSCKLHLFRPCFPHSNMHFCFPRNKNPSVEGGTLCLVALGTADGNVAEQRCRQKHPAGSKVFSCFSQRFSSPIPINPPDVRKKIHQMCKGSILLRKKIGAI